jgi:SAM-dependent methyltransferase
MNDRATGKDDPQQGRPGGTTQAYKKDFWSKEHHKFTQPHFRLERCARIINKIARGRECDLLDVGCGPATLARLLHPNVRYHGIDIAVSDPAPNLLEMDFLQAPIAFGGASFDIVLAQGVFEYVEDMQSQKFAEIAGLLSQNGTFIVSYTNFGHRKKQLYAPFSNVRPIAEFRAGLARHFTVDKTFPVSHNWYHGQPSRWFMKAAQMNISLNIPLISPVLAVEYFFFCSARSGS